MTTREGGGVKDYGLVDLEVHAVELAEADEVGTDKNLKFAALLLPLLAVLGVALVLHPDPELGHLSEVGEDKVDGVVDVALLADQKGRVQKKKRRKEENKVSS